MIKYVNRLIENIKDDIRSEMDIAVLGLSGGVDSTVCAVLATLALGPERVYCVHMPYGEVDLTEGKFNSNSIKIAEKLKVQSLYRPIENAVNALNTVLSFASDTFAFAKDPLSDVNLGNSRSRVRMCVLYGIAHHLETTLEKNVRVLGTGNLSEDYIGYFTKFGDGGADIFPIGELFKSEVYQLAEHFIKTTLISKEMIDYNPSAGLWSGQLDSSEIGYTYDEMEPSIRKTRNPETGFAYTGYEKIISGINHNRSNMDNIVLKKHFNNQHKLKSVPTLPLREFCD